MEGSFADVPRLCSKEPQRVTQQTQSGSSVWFVFLRDVHHLSDTRETRAQAGSVSKFNCASLDDVRDLQTWICRGSYRRSKYPVNIDTRGTEEGNV